MEDCYEEKKREKRVLTVQVASLRVLHIDCNHFPISLALIDHGQDPEHLHFDHLPAGTHLERTFEFAVHFLLTSAVLAF